MATSEAADIMGIGNRVGRIQDGHEADLVILKPKDPSRGNGVVFFDVVNRGRFRLLTTFSAGAAADELRLGKANVKAE